MVHHHGHLVLHLAVHRRGAEVELVQEAALVGDDEAHGLAGFHGNAFGLEIVVVHHDLDRFADRRRITGLADLSMVHHAVIACGKGRCRSHHQRKDEGEGCHYKAGFHGLVLQ